MVWTATESMSAKGTSASMVFLIAMSLLLVNSCRQEDVSQQSPPKQDQPVTGVIASEGYSLPYRIEGSGVPTMVIGSRLYYAKAFSQNLRSHLRLVFLDHRGYVPPPSSASAPEVDFSLEKIVDDMEAARRELELGQIVVVGHSGHSFMALEYAKKYPESVSHVVMIGVGPDISEDSVQAAQQNWEDSASPERKAAMRENLQRLPDEELAKLSPAEANVRRYVRDGPRIWHDPTFDSSALWKGIHHNMAMFDYVWGVVFRDIDITKGLSTLDRPVFLALGRYDFLVPPPAAWEPLRPKFKDLTIQVFEKSGHTPQYEEPDLFDQSLLSWIQAKR
jgi:proline iminopeptidase